MQQIFYGRHTINASDIAAAVEVLKLHDLTQGNSVSTFEKKIKTFCRVPHAVAVSSGTAALHTAMFAIGLKPGDEVITTPFSFAATANCVCYMGATPVFADVVYETGLLDPKEVEKKITNKTKAIITVDYSGHPSYFSELTAIAKKHDIILVDDASHSLGATYHGETIGAQADITTFSFHPVKIITTGEGGMVVTNNRVFCERALLFRTHGITKDPDKFILREHQPEPWYYEMHDLGFNYRLTDIQCALGISQLTRINSFLKKRREIGLLYTRLFNGDRRFKIYRELKGCQSSWHLYPLRLVDRMMQERKKELFLFMKEHGVNLQVHYIPIHFHPYYRRTFGYRPGDFPNAERFYREEISLPIFYDLDQKSIEKVAETLKMFTGSRRRHRILVRLVEPRDQDQIIMLRNADDVRVQFRNTKKVNPSAHAKWFREQLIFSANRRFFVAIDGNQVVGYIRYDLDDDAYHISIAIERKYQQQGVGSTLLSHSLSRMKKFNKPIVAEVKKTNSPSIHFFSAHNFILRKRTTHYAYLMYEEPLISSQIISH